MGDYRPEVAEAMGVFFLVLAGGAAIVAGAGALAVGLAFAFVLSVLVYALGHVSGAHFNPAITLAFAATGHFPPARVVPYLTAQLVGGSAAAFVLTRLGDVAPVATRLHVDVPTGFAIEFLATFLLGLVIIAVATDRRAVRGMGGLAIGLTVGLASLSVGGLTGASLNPARTLGPALASGQYAHLWLYIAAPVLGALSGMAAYEGLRGHRHAPELGSLGPIHLERPSILFACVGNSARSQMAEAFARRMAPRLDIRSGGSQPLGFILPETIAVMQERGFDLRHHTSKPFDEEWIRNECDLVVTMGCGDACPAFIGKRIVDWELADPKGQSIEAFRQVRDDIEKRVAELLRAEAR